MQFKNIYHWTIALAACATVFAIVASPAHAGCGQYGADCSPNSTIVIDKFIRDPRVSGDSYVDNLSYGDYKFSPGEDVVFKVVVRNTGDSTIHNVRVTDIIPSVANMLILSGDARPEMREITKEWGSVGPKESREWYFRVRVKPANEIGDAIVCGNPSAINRARVTSDNTSEQWDSASFCVEKSVQGVSQTPATGTSLMIIAGSLFSIAGAAFVAKKFI